MDPPRGWTVALTTNRATLSALLSEEQGPRESWLKVRGGSGGGGIVRSYFAFLGIATLHFDLVEPPFPYDKRGRLGNCRPRGGPEGGL